MTLRASVLGLPDPASPLGMEWDRLVAATSASGFMQSLSWARFKEAMKLEVVPIGVFEDDKLFAGAIFYTACDNKGAGFLSAPDGPILPYDDALRSKAAMKLILAEAKGEAARLGASALRVAPHLVSLPECLEGFAPAPINLNEKKTLYLDLSLQPEQLLESMKPKGRYNIGLAERRGVKVYEECTQSSVFKFYSVMQQVSARDHFAVEPLAFFINLLGTLANGGMVKLFFAEHEGDILGTLLMIAFGGTATYLYGGTSNLKRNLMGGYALQWAAIKKAKEMGLKVYDFWGFDPECSQESNYAGFSRFKSQFGGEPMNFIGAYDYYFVDHLADAVVKALQEIFPRGATQPPNLSVT